MQRTIVELKDKLLRALDKDNNVVDTPTVVGVLASLEKSYITRECLEETRIGRYVNEMRKKTQDKYLAKRAKNLVRKWQQLVNVPAANSPASFNGSKVAPKSAVPPHVKLSSSKPASPVSRSLTPGSNASSSPDLRKLAGGTRPNTPHNHMNRLSPASAQQSATTTSTKIAFKPISPALQTPVRSSSAACLSRKSPNDLPPRSHNGHSERSTPTFELGAPSSEPTRKAHKRKGGADQNCEIPEKRPYSKSADNDSTCVGNKSVMNGLVKTNPHVVDSVLTASHNKSELSTTYQSSSTNGLVTPAKKQVGKQLLRTPSASSMHSDTLDTLSTPSSIKTPARTPRVKTTAQLLEEMANKGSLNIAGSEAVRKIALNQIDKEHDEDSSIVPAGAKPRARKKPRALVPPSGSGEKTLHETKHEMVHKFLESSVPVPPTPDIDLNDSPTSSHFPHPPRESPTNGVDSAKHNHNHTSSFIGNGSYPHAIDSSSKKRSGSPNDIDDKGLLGDLANDPRRVSPVRIKLSMRRDKQSDEQNIGDSSAMSSKNAPSNACIISNNNTSSHSTSHNNAIATDVDPWSLLPEIDPSTLDFHSLDYEPPEPLEVTPSVIERLHTNEWTGVNGQRDTFGDWRSWTQTYSASSYNGDLLHILPYVVLDEEEQELRPEDPLLTALDGDTDSNNGVNGSSSGERGVQQLENQMDVT